MVTTIGKKEVTQGIILTPTTSAPTGAQGMIYYNSTDKTVKLYDSTAAAWGNAVTGKMPPHLDSAQYDVFDDFLSTFDTTTKWNTAYVGTGSTAYWQNSADAGGVAGEVVLRAKENIDTAGTYSSAISTKTGQLTHNRYWYWARGWFVSSLHSASGTYTIKMGIGGTGGTLYDCWTYSGTVASPSLNLTFPCEFFVVKTASNTFDLYYNGVRKATGVNSTDIQFTFYVYLNCGTSDAFPRLNIDDVRMSKT